MLQSSWVGYHPAPPLCSNRARPINPFPPPHHPRDAPPKETCTRRIYSTNPPPRGGGRGGKGMERARGMWCVRAYVHACFPSRSLCSSFFLLSSCTNRLGRYQGERLKGIPERAFGGCLAFAFSTFSRPPHPTLRPRVPLPLPTSNLFAGPHFQTLFPQTSARAHTHTDPDTKGEKQRAADVSRVCVRARAGRRARGALVARPRLTSPRVLCTPCDFILFYISLPSFLPFLHSCSSTPSCFLVRARLDGGGAAQAAAETRRFR